MTARFTHTDCGVGCLCNGRALACGDRAAMVTA